MTFYRLESPNGGVPVDGACAIYAGRAHIVESISDEEGSERLTFDADGFAPDGWIWHPGPLYSLVVKHEHGPRCWTHGCPPPYGV